VVCCLPMSLCRKETVNWPCAYASIITEPRVVDRSLRHLQGEHCKARNPFEPRPPPPLQATGPQSLHDVRQPLIVETGTRWVKVCPISRCPCPAGHACRQDAFLLEPGNSAHEAIYPETRLWHQQLDFSRHFAAYAELFFHPGLTYTLFSLCSKDRKPFKLWCLVSPSGMVETPRLAGEV
jgi:hypothetical protein